MRDRLSAALAEPGVGLVGVAGGRDLVWGKRWSGRALAGRTNDTASSRGLGAPSADVDAVDGCLMLVAAAALHLDFDVDGFPGFHGYDVDYSLQVRSAGLRVVTRPSATATSTRGRWGTEPRSRPRCAPWRPSGPPGSGRCSRFERVTRSWPRWGAAADRARCDTRAAPRCGAAGVLQWWPRASGGTGRRARFRSWCLWVCGFESRLAHRGTKEVGRVAAPAAAGRVRRQPAPRSGPVPPRRRRVGARHRLWPWRFRGVLAHRLRAAGPAGRRRGGGRAGAAGSRDDGFEEVVEGYFPDALAGREERYDLVTFNDVLEHVSTRSRCSAPPSRCSPRAAGCSPPSPTSATPRSSSTSPATGGVHTRRGILDPPPALLHAGTWHGAVRGRRLEAEQCGGDQQHREEVGGDRLAPRRMLKRGRAGCSATTATCTSFGSSAPVVTSGHDGERPG